LNLMPLRDDLLTPIPGGNPSGVNLYYSSVYDQLWEARRQDDSGPQVPWERQRKTADHRLVVELAAENLAVRSKDLQLAAWLTEALIWRRGFAGLREGLDLILGLLQNFWKTTSVKTKPLFPRDPGDTVLVLE
jgi:type VI secretion system protein ImpA